MKKNKIEFVIEAVFGHCGAVRNVFGFLLLFFSFSAAGIAQDMTGEKKPADKDKIAAFNKDGKIKRGAEIGNSEKVSLKKVFLDPSKYAGKSVRVAGFVVRSCKNEGCWAELGATKDASRTVRVKMKDHAFFIPLQSAGFKILAEGVFSVKTLSKNEVEHLIEVDGAKFANVNHDGTVTELSFLASGVELSKR